MASPTILIVSGSPGTGKTTLARDLAQADPRGLHLTSDVFYRFPAHPLDPTTPESQRQNEAIMKALGRAAGAFAEDGYRVILDGIFGPWFLPVIVRETRASGASLEYVVLRAALHEALQRVREREGAGASARVAHMHRAFADLGRLAAHAVETTGISAAAVRAEVERRRAAGMLALDRWAILSREADAQ